MYSNFSSSPEYATTVPSSPTRTLAPSCLKRPMAVCLSGAEFGFWGSISTTQPKRLGSFLYPGMRASKRFSTSGQRREGMVVGNP